MRATTSNMVPRPDFSWMSAEEWRHVLDYYPAGNAIAWQHGLIRGEPDISDDDISDEVVASPASTSDDEDSMDDINDGVADNDDPVDSRA
eukprot:7302047-Pyramimonas_sp.AAC.1